MPTNSAMPRPKRGAQLGANHAQEIYSYRNQEVVVPTGYLVVGRIVGAHGLRGDMRVELHTDFPDRFAPGARVYICVDLQEVEIEEVRDHKDRLLVKFAGIDDRTAAEGYRDCWLYVEEADSAELADGADLGA